MLVKLDSLVKLIAILVSNWSAGYKLQPDEVCFHCYVSDSQKPTVAGISNQTWVPFWRGVPRSCYANESGKGGFAAMSYKSTRLSNGSPCTIKTIFTISLTCPFSRKRAQSAFGPLLEMEDRCTGWHIRLLKTSYWPWCESCILEIRTLS